MVQLVLFTVLFFLFVPTSTQGQIGYFIFVCYIQKSVDAYICLSYFVAYHSQTGKQTEKHPRRSIQPPVKCALRMLNPRSTLRRVYDTPRDSHSCHVLVQYSSVVVSKYKNKASVTPLICSALPISVSHFKWSLVSWTKSFCKDTKIISYLYLIRYKLN